MSLFVATFLAACLLFAIAYGIHRGGRHKAQALAWLSRDKLPAAILWVTASIWFLFHISRLGEADFGQYRQFFLVGFGAVAILSWVYLPDLLGLRAIGVLAILTGHQFLNAAWMQDPHTRLLLVVVAFSLIIKGMVVGASPYRLRNALEWVWGHPKRIQFTTVTLAVTGGLLLLTAFVRF